MELITAISNLGVLIVIAFLFLKEHYTSDKNTQTIQKHNAQILEEMKVTNNNTAKALEIIKQNQEYTISITERIEKKIDCIKEKANIVKKEVK